MTTAYDIDLRQLVEDRLTGASPDLLTMFVHALMGAEADALCGAGYGQRSDDRLNGLGRLPAPRLRYPRRHPRRGHPQVAVRLVLPGLAARAA